MYRNLFLFISSSLLSFRLVADSMPRDFKQRCFVWNLTGCTEKSKRADRVFIDSANRKGNRVELAKQLVSQGWQIFEKKKDSMDAAQKFNQALLLDDKMAEAWFGAGTVLSNAFVFDKAEQLLQKAIALDPTKANYYVNLGRLYGSHRKDYLRAEKYFLKALDVDPNFNEVYLHLAFLNYYLNEVEKAKDYEMKAKEKGVEVPADFSRDLASKIIQFSATEEKKPETIDDRKMKSPEKK